MNSKKSSATLTESGCCQIIHIRGPHIIFYFFNTDGAPAQWETLQVICEKSSVNWALLLEKHKVLHCIRECPTFLNFLFPLPLEFGPPTPIFLNIKQSLLSSTSISYLSSLSLSLQCAEFITRNIFMKLN